MYKLLKNVSTFVCFTIIVIFTLNSSVALATDSPISITGYKPGDEITNDDILHSYTYFDDEIVTRNYIVKSKSEKSKLPFTMVSAVLVNTNKFVIYKVQIVVDICDAVELISEFSLPDSQRKENRRKREECKSVAKGLHLKLPTIYGEKYNYYSTFSMDYNFDPQSTCAVAIKSIHGALLKCKEWSTPKANRLGVYFNELIEVVPTAQNFEYGDSLQTTFLWHDEILEEKLKFQGVKFKKEKENEQNRKASERINLFE
jgi:hypothetical protein